MPTSSDSRDDVTVTRLAPMHSDAGRRATPSAEGAAGGSGSRSRAPFVAPRLEPLGEWSAFTLQQSVPIGPGNY